MLELVHRLREAGAEPVRTKGYVTYLNRKWMPSFWDREARFRPLQRALLKQGLKGPKLHVKSLNPDLSMVLPGRQAPVNLDIKTQINPQEVLIDALIAKWHNDHERRRDYQQAFLWVVLEPREEPFRSRFRKSADKVGARAMRTWDVDLSLRPVEGAPGVRYALVAPGLPGAR